MCKNSEEIHQAIHQIHGTYCKEETRKKTGEIQRNIMNTLAHGLSWLVGRNDLVGFELWDATITGDSALS